MVITTCTILYTYFTPIHTKKVYACFYICHIILLLHIHIPVMMHTVISALTAHRYMLTIYIWYKHMHGYINLYTCNCRHTYYYQHTYTEQKDTQIKKKIIDKKCMFKCICYYAHMYIHLYTLTYTYIWTLAHICMYVYFHIL